MRHEFLAVVGALAIVVGVSVMPVFVAAQSPAAAASTSTLLRTPWGEPDLQGIWNRDSDAPLQRPAEYAGREFLTDEEVAALDRKRASDPRYNAAPAPGNPGTYNAVFQSILRASKRTSLIVDPPDGRFPPLVPGASVRVEHAGGPDGGGNRESDNPEDRAWPERCLGDTLPGIGAGNFGGPTRIVQSPGYVALYTEYGHGGGAVRVIPTDGSPHAPAHMHKRLGDARGRWDGNTLLVDITSFSPGTELQTIGQWTLGPRTSNANLHMIERFTRIDANTLRREVTIDDPTTWTRPWTVLQDMRKTDERANRIYESSCHEGNFGLTGILAGARAQEKAAGSAGVKK